MGFFQPFENIWKDGWTWKGVEDGFSQAASSFKDAGKSFLGGLWNTMVGTSTLNPDRFRQGVNAYLDFGKNILGGGANALMGGLQVPVLKQTFQTLDTAQNELIRRPVGTVGLTAVDAGFNGKSLFDFDTWKQAYNDTRTVSVGQAIQWAGMAYPVFPGQTVANPIAVQNADPRTEQGQDYWHNNTAAKWFSGGADVAVVLAADPTRGAFKIGKATKLRYLTKPMDAAAITRGEPAKFLDSDRYEKLFDFYRTANNADITHQTVFRNTPSGGVANKILFDAAKVGNEGDARQLFTDSLLHLWGDPQAKYRLAESAPRLLGADNVLADGRRVSDVAKDFGTGDPAVDAIVNARRETHAQAFLDDVANGDSLYGKAAGALAYQPQPRVALTSKWRVGIHQFAQGASGNTFFAPAGRMLRPFLPSSTFTRIINFEDPGATPVENLRSNWEGAGVLRPDELGKHVQAYATAATSEGRFAAFSDGENAIFKAVAGKYGFSADEAERVMGKVNSMRQTQRIAFSQSRRYMSNDARKLAQALWDANAWDESARARQLADEIDSAVARGDHPTSHLDVMDEDGNHVLIPENFDVSGSPISPTQYADVAAAMDWKLLHQALWWEKRGPIGQKAYTVLDNTRALLDAASSVWKVSQLLRPGYAIRMLSDEGFRALSLIGAGPTFSGMVNGASNLVQNMWSRSGRPVTEDYLAKRAALGATTHSAVDGEDLETGVAHTDLAEQRGRLEDVTGPDGKPLGKKARRVVQAYTTLGKAVSDGVIAPSDYVGAALRAFDNRPRDVTADMASIIRRHRDAGSDPSSELLEHALWQQGRASFGEATWRRALIDDVTSRRTVVTDPFSGTSPEVLPNVSRLSNTVRIHPADETQAIEDYVHANADELLKPTSMLHAQIMRDGIMELSVAKIDAADAVKPTGGRRVKVRGKDYPYMQGGTGGTVINTPNGPIQIDHAFDGAEGARLMAQVSSRGEGQSWADRISDKGYQERMQATRNMWRDVGPNEEHYGPSWERVVNVQLGNDAVARQILSGATDDEIVSWMRKTRDGQAYLRRLGPWQSRYWVQIASVRKMVDMYIPDHALGTGKAEELRKAVLDRSATFDQLKATVPDVHDMPTVHGTAIEAAVPGKAAELYRKAVDNTFKAIGDIPADRMARFPFAAERYQVHAQHLADTYFAQYHKAGYDSVPADILTRVQEQARQRAAADVKKYLYDAATSHDVVRLARLVVPFGSAALDSFTKWGRIAKENPWVPYNLWKVWTAPDKGGHTTDENGNHRRWINGNPRWVSFDPVSGKETVLPQDYTPHNEYVSLQLASDLLPSFLSGEVDGVKLNPTVNKDSFNTFLGLPTAGPLVAVPANTFALSNPEFSENRFVKMFVLPLGPQQSSGNLFVPGWMRTAYEMSHGEDGGLAQSQALAIYQTEMVRYSTGERPKPPTFGEARDKASKLMGLRMLYQLSGVTPQWKTPYQPYVDYYRQLRAQDPHNADARFYDEAGPEFFILTAAVTRNVAGIPATVGGFKAYKKYEDLINAHPDIANLIIGAEGAGTFSQSVYQYQLDQAMQPGSDKRMRERMSVQESVEDTAVRMGWVKYGKLMDMIDSDLMARGLTSVNQRGAEDLKEAKDRFVQANMYWNQSPDGGKQLNPWFVDYSTQDKSRIIGRLNAMSQIINDPRLSKRDDIRGLADYMAARKQMTDMMDADGITTLNSKKATAYRGMWDQYVMSLKDQNLSFSSLYGRWLTGDQYLDARY